jgi:hypothetical protein
MLVLSVTARDQHLAVAQQDGAQIVALGAHPGPGQGETSGFWIEDLSRVERVIEAAASVRPARDQHHAVGQQVRSVAQARDVQLARELDRFAAGS